MQSQLANVIILAIIIFVVYRLFRWLKIFIAGLFTVVTIFEYQRGLHYRKGKIHRVVEAGRYWLFTRWDIISTVDMRDTVLSLTNQEVVCTDNLVLRMSAAAIYRVADPVKAVQQTQNYFNSLYFEAQLALRECTAGLKVEEVLSKRNEISVRFVEHLAAQAKLIGLEITSGGIKDLTFPADVKKIFSQVSNAEKAAQAALTKSRSESASLRSLANAARMMEGNPNLLALRTLQSLSELAASSGNTVVFGLPPNFAPSFGSGSKTVEVTSHEVDQGL
jgi:regulator of protease activity HflC (stomatin/prohibitin superfamily)